MLSFKNVVNVLRPGYHDSVTQERALVVASVFAGWNKKVTAPIARCVRTSTKWYRHQLRNFPAPTYECSLLRFA
jgi:hypothetical protein